MANKNIHIIVAIAQNNAIGFQNKLLYWLPNDLKRFKELTTGHTIIMGRRTFESLPKGALPNRKNVVLSKSGMPFPGAETYTSLEEALDKCTEQEEVYIIGGASLYKEAINVVQVLHITEIEDTPAEADAFFPELENGIWQVVSKERHEKDEKHAYAYTFVDYVRK